MPRIPGMDGTRATSMLLRRFRVRTLAVTHIRFVHVLEQRIALCLVSFLCVSTRQAVVESILDRKPHSGASLSLLPPAKNQQRIQPFEQLPSDLLDLVA